MNPIRPIRNTTADIFAIGKAFHADRALKILSGKRVKELERNMLEGIPTEFEMQTPTRTKTFMSLVHTAAMFICNSLELKIRPKL